MIDPRFYDLLGPITAADLAGDLPVRGDRAHRARVPAPLAEAGPETLTYAEKAPRSSLAVQGVMIVRPQDAGAYVLGAGALLLAASPRTTFARLAGRLAQLREDGPPGPPKAEPSAIIHPHAHVAADAEIGAGAIIEAGAVIGPGCAVGRGTRVGARAVVRCALIGDQVRIGAGAVIGESGFGVAGDADGLVDMPHLGRVIIQDRVSIGANTTIDRGMLVDTVIGEDTKIDNLCQIAHNVQIGRGVVIAAYGGISGSSVVGDGVRMGGRVGLADHVTVGRGASLAAGSAVMHDVPAGETWGGYPAKPMRAWMREIAWLKRMVGRRNGEP